MCPAPSLSGSGSHGEINEEGISHKGVIKKPAGFCSTPVPVPLDLKAFLDGITPQDFDGITNFIGNIRFKPFPTKDGKMNGKKVLPPTSETFIDCLSLRAYLVFARLNAVVTYKKCVGCKGPCRLVQVSRTDTIKQSCQTYWTCKSWQKFDCWRVSVCHDGILSKLKTNSWFPFLQMIIMMKEDTRMKVIYKDLEQAYGLHQTTVDDMKALHLDTLKKYIDEVDGAYIGAKSAIIVCDETAVSKDIPTSGKPKGFKPKARGPLSRRNPFLKKVLPARTIWKKMPTAVLKKPAAVMKRPATVLKKPAALIKRPATVMKKPATAPTRFYKGVVGTDKDKRSNTRWAWIGVEVAGADKVKKSHKLGNKRVTIGLLPRKADAVRGKPRGEESLQKQFEERVRPGSHVVCDEWKSTPKAAAAGKSKVVGSVAHRSGFRNRKTGYHSNDAESEVGRFKLFMKVRNSYVRTTNATTEGAKDVHLQRVIAEYMFYTNVGRSTEDIMKAYRHAAGIKGKSSLP